MLGRGSNIKWNLRIPATCIGGGRGGSKLGFTALGKEAEVGAGEEGGHFSPWPATNRGRPLFETREAPGVLGN